MSAGNKTISSTTVKLGIYEQSNDAQLASMLGQVKELDDGRKFRLCFANGSLTAGILVQSPATEAYDDELVVNTAASVGDKEIEITVTSGHGGYDENYLSGGFLMVTKGTNCIGNFYKIKGNDAMVAGATATVFLYDALVVAIAASDEVGIAKNPYKDVVTGSTTAPVIGVPLIAVTDNYYFWAQFEGMGPGIDSGATIAAGDELSHVGGDVIIQDGSEDKDVGMSINAAAANEGVIVNYKGI